MNLIVALLKSIVGRTAEKRTVNEGNLTGINTVVRAIKCLVQQLKEAMAISFKSDPSLNITTL
jgi:hypothetical protein